MGFYDVLEEAGKASGVSMRGVAAALSKGPAYVARAKSRGSVPSVDNAAAMLAAAGYALVAVPIGDVPAGALAIEPPARDVEAEQRAALERKRERLRRELAATDKLLG